jgi:hypothetical protein
MVTEVVHQCRRGGLQEAEDAGVEVYDAAVRQTPGTCPNSLDLVPKGLRQTPTSEMILQTSVAAMKLRLRWSGGRVRPLERRPTLPLAVIPRQCSETAVSHQWRFEHPFLQCCGSLNQQTAAIGHPMNADRALATIESRFAAQCQLQTPVCTSRVAQHP